MVGKERDIHNKRGKNLDVLADQFFLRVPRHGAHALVDHVDDSLLVRHQERILCAPQPRPSEKQNTQDILEGKRKQPFWDTHTHTHTQRTRKTKKQGMGDEDKSTGQKEGGRDQR